jgi:hypothetical protein
MAFYDVAIHTCQVHCLSRHRHASLHHVSYITWHPMTWRATFAGPYNAVAAATGPHIQVWPASNAGAYEYSFNYLGIMATPNGVMLGRLARH